MFQISRTIEFCYGHRLLDYQGKCKNLHGHNGKAVIVIEAGELDRQGMVLDFSEIKRVLAHWIDENLDHKMLLRRDDPAVAAMESLDTPMFLMDANPTAENIARLIFDVAVAEGLPVAKVKFWETPGCQATYCN